MHVRMVALAALLAAAPAMGLAKGRAPAGASVSSEALVAAARHAKLRSIDYEQEHCDGDLDVDTWLKALTGSRARAIQWTGGRCRLTDTLNPLDAGGRWCAQAAIVLVHPASRRDRPMVEIYLEAPRHGRPGAAYAFRSFMIASDGPDYSRFRKDFEADWSSRFARRRTAASCDDEASE